MYHQKWEDLYKQNLDCKDFGAKMAEWNDIEENDIENDIEENIKNNAEEHSPAAFDWAAIDGVIFDMDGTLVDSMCYWLHLPVDWFKRQGVPLPTSLAEEFATADLWQACDILARKYAAKPTDTQAVFNELQAEMDRHYAQDIALMPTRRELLQALLAANKPACIATMTDRPQVQTMLKTHNLVDCFKFVITTPEVGAGKDKPDIFLQAAEKLGTKPQRTLVVEDSRTAIKTALAAGFVVAAVKTPGYNYDEINRIAAQNGAKLYYIDDFSALMPIAK